MSLVNYDYGPGVSLKDIDNEYTLNIFTDASIRKKGRESYDGCYGAIAVYRDQVIDSIYRIASDSTNNNSEIKGVRAGVFLALKYRNRFRVINIFSDSQISIFGIRDRLINWYIDKGVLINKSGTPVQSQEIYLEIVYLMIQHNLRVNFIHQKGHVNGHIDKLLEAQHVFKTSNSIRGKVDLNMIRYISKWNNVVDGESRSILSQNDPKDKYVDAIEFYPTKFNRNLYNRLAQNTIKKGQF